MLLYSHMTNISPRRHQLIMQKTKGNGWNQETLSKNNMMKDDVYSSGSWEITKEENGFYHDILLDKHMILYRLHGLIKEKEKFRRMKIWEDQIRIDNKRNKSVEDILESIETFAETDQDKIYLANKLLRNRDTGNKEINKYLNSI